MPPLDKKVAAWARDTLRSETAPRVTWSRGNRCHRFLRAMIQSTGKAPSCATTENAISPGSDTSYRAPHGATEEPGEAVRRVEDPVGGAAASGGTMPATAARRIDSSGADTDPPERGSRTVGRKPPRKTRRRERRREHGGRHQNAEAPAIEPDPEEEGAAMASTAMAIAYTSGIPPAGITPCLPK